MKKFVAFLVVMFVVVCNSLIVTSAYNPAQNMIIPFDDVPSDYWAKDEIDYFTSKKIVNGVGGNKFEPESGVTREQLAKMLALTFGAALKSPEESTFSDVSKADWSYPYVEVCKDFLTGYANPFSEKPVFHPEEYATREDIAVALVRIMGFTEKDAVDPDYAMKFKDYDKITPSLYKYISLATEKKLINGYPDGTYAPNKGITRAETVVLLKRATKQLGSVTNEVQLSAEVLYDTDSRGVTIKIESEEGAIISVDGMNIPISSNGNGKYEGTYLYRFTEEGSKTFEVKATKNGKTTKKNVTAKYEVEAPILNITDCPTAVTSKDITISGTLTDSRYKVSLAINGESVSVGEDGTWFKSFVLNAGDNKFLFEAYNSEGKKLVQERTVTFNTNGPQLVITDCPATATNKEITIKGTLMDSTNIVSLTVNEKEVFIDKDGYWNIPYTLKDGENKLTFVASNSEGKKVTQEKIVTFNDAGPNLLITDCPTTVIGKNIVIKGTLTDSNYSAYLTINGERVDLGVGGYWAKQYVLKEGENKFIFEALNSDGKKTTIERTIVFNDNGPQFEITECPTTAADKYISISGILRDSNYNVALTINGESVGIDPTGHWGKIYILKEGENKLYFEATNANGKKVTAEKTVVFNVGGPEINFLYFLDSSSESSVYIKGTLDGLNDGVRLYINDKEVSLLDENSIWTNKFSVKVDLNVGDNTFVFKAVNSYGKSTTVVKTIKYDGLKVPLLKVNDTVNGYIAKTDTYTITISGSVTDNQDSSVNVYVNGKLISTGNGNWSANVELHEGNNDIAVVASNKYGKSMKIVKSISYFKEKA